MPAEIELHRIVKRYATANVLSSISLRLEAGQFTSLIGRSGSGKTTLLNLIAGLDQPSGGAIVIGGRKAYDHDQGIDLPAHKRDIGYVFQSYALWPHMRVVDNVAYPLRVRGTDRATRVKAAEGLLDRLEIGDLGARFPFELSGGQQQRVAIARALVHHPQVLLLDEPLSNLDVQLRDRARAWIGRIHREFNLTTVLVTHDHAEALSISDRIVLLRDGKVEQDASARDIYERPRTIYAADFIGGVNTFRATVESSEAHPGGGARTRVRFRNGAALALVSDDIWTPGSLADVTVRPGRVLLTSRLEASTDDRLALPLTIDSRLYRGEDWEVLGTTPLGEIKVVAADVPMGAEIFAVIGAADCRCLPV